MTVDNQEASDNPGDTPDAEALVREGLEHHRAGRGARAERLYRRALKLEPHHPEALHHLGILAQQAGRTEMAAAILKEAIEAAPADPGPMNSLARVLGMAGRSDDALDYLRRAERTAPDFAPTYLALGMILHRKGQTEEADAAWQAGLERAPTHSEMLTNLGGLRLSQGRGEEALVLLDRALVAKPRFAPAELNRGRVLEQLGRRDEAEAAYGRAVEFDPGLADAHYAYGRLHRYTPTDPVFPVLRKLANQPGVSPAVRPLALFTLAKALDDIRAYADAYAAYGRANEAMRRNVVFDRADHARLIQAVETAATTGSGGEAPAAGPRPLFLIGMPASAKVQLGELLSGHAEMEGDIRDAFVPELLVKALQGTGKTTVLPDGLAEADGAVADALGKAIREEIGRRTTRPRFFLTSLPDSHLYVGLLARACPEALFLAVERDPMDLGFALYSTYFGAAYPYSYDEATIGFYLSGYRRLMNHWRKLFGVRLIDVVYEDFIADPDTTLRQIGLRLELSAAFAPVAPDANWPEVGRWRRYESYLGDLRTALRA